MGDIEVSIEEVESGVGLKCKKMRVHHRCVSKRIESAGTETDGLVRSNLAA
jgi:hypothetical protein